MATRAKQQDGSDGVKHSADSVLTLQKGSTVFHQGDPASHWYEVLSGAVRTCRFLADGHRQLTGFFYCDDVFGLDAGRYIVTAEAMTPVILHRRPNAVAAPSFQIGRALKSAQDYIALFAHRTASERLAAFLVSIAEKPGAGERITLPMSRADIADHLGLTIHTVSRTISDFAKRKIIRVDDRAHINVLNREKLELEAGQI